jgi:ABC-type transport system involved in multi-copper enzyme maturation permease subunit
VSVTGAFLAHEATLQLRSPRYRAAGFAYVLLCTLPAAVLFLIAHRVNVMLGSSATVSLLDDVQPFLTALLVALLAVDGITREREENSFPVVSLAPLSATGYLLRRWLAIVALLLPLTLLPRILSAALAALQTHRAPLLAAFAGGWLLRVVPVLLLVSALALALGTINGNTILAILLGFVLLNAGVDEVNDFAAYAHRHFEGAGTLIGFNPRMIQELTWSVRGYYVPQFPTEAAYAFGAELESMLPRAALLFGLTAVCLGIASFYLRRTRRDIRPWRVREDHPLRSFHRLFNRLRDAYTPDGAPALPEWLALAAGVMLFALSLTFLSHLVTHFERLGAERYAAWTSATPLPMPPDVAPVSVRVRGTLARDGRLRVRAALAMRNNSTTPQAHLGFLLNPLLDVRQAAAGRGRAAVTRHWQRLGIELEPPLAAGETRVITFDLDGCPGDVRISIPWSGTFASKWRRYVHATKSVDLSDLSRSTVGHAVDETRLALEPGDLMPVPRYAPWRIEEETDAFVPESLLPPAALDVVLAQPFAVAADSCGHLATGGAAMESRCTTAPGTYRVAGGPLVTTSLGPGLTLAHIPAHGELARLHGPALGASLALAERVWPGLALPHSIVFVERPRPLGTGGWAGRAEWLERHTLSGSGALQLVPEDAFIAFEPMQSGLAAGTILLNELRARRRVATSEADFFRAFYELAVFRRVGAGHAPRRAVIPAFGVRPYNAAPLAGGTDRLPYITSALESRAGADHVREGINDFVAAPGRGDARQLFDAIGRRAGVDLTVMYDDFIAGAKTPRLTLADVAFTRSGGGWQVRGTLRNEGSGQALCPLALRTAAGSQWQTVRVDGGTSVTFVFTAASAPRTLQLDPNGVCFREAFVGALESLDASVDPSVDAKGDA